MMTGPAAETDIAIVNGLGEIAPRYDTILCDVWGVLHDGLVAFPPASAALTRFRAGGGRVVLVSNAPRPGESVVAQLDSLRVPRTAYDAIVTSGDLTRQAVIDRLDQVVHHLGPERDLPIFEGLDVRFGDIETADYVVCSGLRDDDRETLADYQAPLARLRERNVWMICANPDIVVERGDDLVLCAGALAQAYEEIGGTVYYAGKPHGPVYETALMRAARIAGREGERLERRRILAIGDAIRTDIAGAADFGIDSLLVARGIHAANLGAHEGPLDPVRVEAWLSRQPVRPSAVTTELVWA